MCSPFTPAQIEAFPSLKQEAGEVGCVVSPSDGGRQMRVRREKKREKNILTDKKAAINNSQSKAVSTGRMAHAGERPSYQAIIAEFWL